MGSALNAEDSLQAFNEKLEHVVAFPGGMIKNLISSSNKDAANYEPFCAAHDEQCKGIYK
jgi:hypothetical protein